MQNTASATLIVKITHACNLRCEYCFYRRQLRDTAPAQLEPNDLRLILAKSAERWKSISLVIHGGEPLVMPPSYFRSLLEYEREMTELHGTVFRNSLQTNGTLLGPDHLDLIRRAGIHVGISVDGPRHLHDANRPEARRCGSHADVLGNLRLLRDAGIDPSALLVATRRIVDDPRGVYSFFKSQRLDFKINELYPKTTSEEIVPTNRALASFFTRLFDLWFDDLDVLALHIRPFTSIIAAFWGAIIGDCTYQSDCSHFLIIETDGSVFPCARFQDDFGFCLGNILKHPWEQILHSPVLAHLESRRARLPAECKQCQWLTLCWGGCAACALHAQDTLFGKTRWCDARRVLFGHIWKRINRLLEEQRHATAQLGSR